MRSPLWGSYCPDSSAAYAAAPPGSLAIRKDSHSARCAARIASSSTSSTRSTYFCASGNMSSPTRFGARESAAMPPASASTGLPACNALLSVGARRGSTPMSRIRFSYHAAMPPISPPPPTATSNVSSFGACSSSSRPHAGLPEERRFLVEGVDLHRTAFRSPLLGRRQSIGIAIANHLEMGAVGTDALDLRRRRHGRHIDARWLAEFLRCVRDRRAMVATRCCNHAGARNL